MSSNKREPKPPTKRQLALAAIASLRADGRHDEADVLERLAPKARAKPKPRPPERETAFDKAAADYEAVRREFDKELKPAELESWMIRLCRAVDEALAFVAQRGKDVLDRRAKPEEETANAA